jgi:mannose-6-phosphate isomerase
MSDQSSEILSPQWFDPVFRQYLWGGRRLGEILGKPIGPEPRYAECWEIVDHGPDQSVVAWGHCGSQSRVGWSLNRLMSEQGAAVVGPAWHSELNRATHPPQLRGRFPLLIKWLDAQQNLSLQVHPNDRQAGELYPPDLGKSEAWYVADARPGALVYAGLLPGVSRREFEQASRAGRIREILHSFSPKVGDCIYIPAGTIHAIGAGLLIAEVQQASDTTYRLYDWDRVGDNGLPRALQVEQALAVTDWQRGPVQPTTPRVVKSADSNSDLAGRGPANATTAASQVEILVDGPYFSLQRWTVDGEVELPRGACQILIALSGTGRLSTTGQSPAPEIRTGSTVLLPFAAAGCRFIAQTPASFLLASLPEPPTALG